MTVFFLFLLATTVGSLSTLYSIPEDDLGALYWKTVRDTFRDQGLLSYEISNYARQGCESAHNRSYWRGEDYLGIGPGAVSTVDSRRWTNVEDTAKYVELVRSLHKETSTARHALEGEQHHDDQDRLDDEPPPAPHVGRARLCPLQPDRGRGCAR